MIFVIADIHGELIKLKQLIEVLSHYPIEKLIFVGDYVDKGPDSKNTLDFLLILSKKFDCIFLEGDHERAWINKEYEFLNRYGGIKTLQSFGLEDFDDSKIETEIRIKYTDFFSQLKKNFIIYDHQILHTGSGTRYEFLKSLPKDPKYKLVFGHTAFYTPFVDPYKIGIDTGATYYPQAALTAFEITKQFFINHFGEKTDLKTIAFSSCPIIIRLHDKW